MAQLLWLFARSGGMAAEANAPGGPR